MEENYLFCLCLAFETWVEFKKPFYQKIQKDSIKLIDFTNFGYFRETFFTYNNLYIHFFNDINYRYSGDVYSRFSLENYQIFFDAFCIVLNNHGVNDIKFIEAFTKNQLTTTDIKKRLKINLNGNLDDIKDNAGPKYYGYKVMLPIKNFKDFDESTKNAAKAIDDSVIYNKVGDFIHCTNEVFKEAFTDSNKSQSLCCYIDICGVKNFIRGRELGIFENTNLSKEAEEGVLKSKKNVLLKNLLFIAQFKNWIFKDDSFGIDKYTIYGKVIKISTFSDTIVISVNSTSRDQINVCKDIVECFIRYVIFFQQVILSFGFLTKGAIVFGNKLIHEKTLFLGDTFIEAYEITEKNKMPCVVIDETAKNFFAKNNFLEDLAQNNLISKATKPMFDEIDNSYGKNKQIKFDYYVNYFCKDTEMIDGFFKSLNQDGTYYTTKAIKGSIEKPVEKERSFYNTFIEDNIEKYEALAKQNATEKNDYKNVDKQIAAKYKILRILSNNCKSD
jgi:hypothetical protein